MKNSFIKKVFLISSNTIIAQVATLLGIWVCTKIYQPHDFGLYQYYLSVLAFFVLIGAFKYELAILTAKTEDEAINITIFCFYTILMLTSLYFLVVIAFEIINAFNYKLSYWVWLIPLSFFFAALYIVVNNLLIRLEQFKKIGTTKISQSVGMVSSQILLGWLSIKPAGLFLGDLVGKMAGIHKTFIWVIEEKKDILKKFNKIIYWQIAYKYKNFLIYALPATLFNTSVVYIPSLFIGSLYGEESLGYYSLADKIFSVPFLLIGLSISQVYTSKVNQLLDENNFALRTFFIRLTLISTISILLPFFFFYLYAPSLFEFVFSKKWIISGEIASIMCIMQFFGFVSSIVSNTLLLIQKQRVQMFWDATRLACVSLVLYFVKINGVELKKMVLYYSAIMGLFYCIHLLLSYKMLKLHTQNK